MHPQHTLLFYLNGKRIELRRVEPETTLLQYLRDTAGLSGSKLGCGEGGCGACTVMVSHYSHTSNSIIHRAINGCLMPLAAIDGMAVTTIEGLGNVRDGLDPVQERIANGNGSQCGYCTPGIVMALYAYLRSNPGATAEDLEHCLDGNLCRCTGYRPILDAAKSFALDRHEHVSYVSAELVQQGSTPPASGKGICPSTGEPCDCGNQGTTSTGAPSGPACFDPSKLKTHLIFPSFLKKYTPVSKEFVGEKVTWYTPLTLHEILLLKERHPSAKLVVGNTEIGIDRKFRHMKFPYIISPIRVPELNQITLKESGIHIGAAVSLSNLQQELKHILLKEPAYKTESLKAMLEQLAWFAGTQIRNAACLGGNICTASPISDLNPVLIAAHAILTLQSTKGSREVPIRKFFLRYRTIDLLPDEILVSVFVPFTRKNEFFHGYKQARRREDDIAIVTSGIRVLLEAHQHSWKISEIAFGYGGMAPTTVFCPNTEKQLVGRTWNDDLIPVANALLESDLPLPDNAPGGMIHYRRTLTTSFFYKFYLYVSEKLALDSVTSRKRELSAIPSFSRAISSGQQNYVSKEESYPVGCPVVHSSAHKQVTGEALYADDVPTQAYHAALVGSKKAHAKLLRIDASAALELPGVVGFFSAKDISGKNEVGPIIKSDEPLFASDVVTAMGQPLGIIVATTHELACEASRLVEVEYEELPPIITIEQAIEQNSFYSHVPLELERGNVSEAFKTCDQIVEGQVHMGGQEHFYLEPNCTLATPGELDEISILCSSQSPGKTQSLVAHVLGIPDNRVTVTVKRMGGGFGGKETRTIFVSCAAALAAFKLRKAVKLTLDRDVDMTTTGLRHPFLGKYKVGVNNDGSLQALQIELFSNAGNSLDLSIQVMERAVFHVDNTYFIPNLKVVGKLCKTNITTNTAFRGFGAPQSMFICESWINHVADQLQIDVNVLREKNFYQPEQVTHYGQLPSDNHIHQIWSQLMSTSNYASRKLAVEEFNAQNRWKKRGIACVPTKFGMSFTAKVLNQAGALVHIYTDGSVLVSHGGTEMGQGLHTKICQIAAHTLQVPLERVYITDTSTDKVPNSSPTAASVQSDINGMAVKLACDTLVERLAPLRTQFPDLTWEQLIVKAYLERVDLSAHGFYATPNVGYNFETHAGSPFNYFVWGASCSEVEIDVLTGDHNVLRSDILMDLGESLNPTIDIGQIEGGFVQGQGLMTLEEIVWFDSGFQFTRGPGTYKIPSFNDVPVDLRVSLLQGSANKRAIHSSKGVGEPPLFLAASVFFAIKNACSSARQETGESDKYWVLNSPATSERIRMACVDDFTKQFRK